MIKPAPLRARLAVALIATLVVVALDAVATDARAQSLPQAQQVSREEIETAADNIGIPEGVDRQCVIEHAVQAAPNVSVGMLDASRLNRAQRQQANELGRRIRAGAAVQEGLQACTPEGAQTPAQDTTVTNAQP
ncbi:MAG: hypothetical protein R3C30_04825 [Hyphomonadaceae bacterium]